VLHQELLLLYINDILSALDLESIRESVLVSISDFKVYPEPKPAYTEFILNRNPRRNEPSNITSFWNTRLKLVELLQSGLKYDAMAALERIETQKELLLAELVILYGRVFPSCVNAHLSSFGTKKR